MKNNAPRRRRVVDAKIVSIQNRGRKSNLTRPYSLFWQFAEAQRNPLQRQDACNQRVVQLKTRRKRKQLLKTEEPAQTRKLRHWIAIRKTDRGVIEIYKVIISADDEELNQRALARLQDDDYYLVYFGDEPKRYDPSDEEKIRERCRCLTGNIACHFALSSREELLLRHVLKKTPVWTTTVLQVLG